MMQDNMKTLVRGGPLLGSSVWGAVVVQAPAHVTPSIFPPVNPQFVECAAFQGSQQYCSRVVNEIYQLVALILDQLEDNDLPTALQELLPTTPQMFPDGRSCTVLKGWDLSDHYGLDRRISPSAQSRLIPSGTGRSITTRLLHTAASISPSKTISMEQYAP